MPNKYSITIYNKTGSPQNYNLFTEKPNITGVVQSNIWTNIYQIAHSTPDGASAEFEMWKQYYAISGTWRGGEKEGAKVSISQTRPVTLGAKANDDSPINGTTLNLVVIDKVTPSFDKVDPEATSYNNAYEVVTGNDFTLADANDSEYSLVDFLSTQRLTTIDNFFIGLASSPDGSKSSPTATFKPEPGNSYQIEPVNTYYITYGGTFAVGELLNVAKLSKKPLAIDFTTHKADVAVNHNADGTFVIVK
ncbi:hypothetical protein E4T42_08723 [Aureobasidium subglaciale]|nr:hypothetical protein E4T38_06129 [Aureobasidium subglaciale]KAI5219921.1 hypothetical protein E4T40_06150 [Aureobasidium subglaciale]KAI5223645.1 hypothetical protein E4T41_06047 [Aureobasidium subglaciale]KAI5239364.1 hypothetical protein E4T42_08723 [Aureobasidium subglaciale]KAI5260536.1 hypothetical protein E4T46_05884 [Aureobasidium subglaciale]